MCRRGLIVLSVLWVTLCPMAARAQATDAAPGSDHELPLAAVVSIGGVDGGRALSAAREAGGARYHGATVRAASRPAPEPPTAEIEALRATYLEADFLRCLVRSRDEALDLDHLLSLGHREAAATAGVLGAACAFGAEDPDRARLLLHRLMADELELTDALRITGADFQAVAEAVRADVLAAPRVDVTIVASPTDATVAVDGGSHGCRMTPCTLHLLPGTHEITVSRLGRDDRSISRELTASTRLAVALDPAPAERILQQLAYALDEGASPGSGAFLRAAADAEEVRVVVAVWEADGRTHAALFDRARGRIVARISTDETGRVDTAVRSVVREWRGINEPRPIVRHPAFWLGIIGAAAVAGLTVGLLLRPGDVQHDVVFGIR